MAGADDERRRGPTTYDSELHRHNEVLRRACDIQIGERVLDIGCGTGLTTRQAARTARAGSAFGVDVSASAIERARELAQAEGLRNVTFERADAQVCQFPQEHYDVAISRFGTMFFDDPGAAFSNIGLALRPGGRLVMMVWQPSDHNEWDVVIRQSLGAVEQPMASPSGSSDPFSFGDPRVVSEILDGARFVDVGFSDVREPVYYGPDVTSALEWVRSFSCTSEALRRLPGVDRDRSPLLSLSGEGEDEQLSGSARLYFNYEVSIERIRDALQHGDRRNHTASLKSGKRRLRHPGALREPRL